ncbi:MAG: hypothetical protein N3A66_07820 [Planctomycetota bacterium]|nr:hypothetical protein [Planctomycetota bacterium]
MAAILEEVRCGPISYRAADDLPFGVGWNTGSNYHTGCGFTRWLADFSHVCLATTFEIPYANHRDLTLTPEMVRAFGADLAKSLQRYFLDSV